MGTGWGEPAEFHFGTPVPRLRVFSPGPRVPSPAQVRNFAPARSTPAPRRQPRAPYAGRRPLQPNFPTAAAAAAAPENVLLMGLGRVCDWNGGARKGGQALFAGGKKLEVTEGGVFFFLRSFDDKFG